MSPFSLFFFFVGFTFAYAGQSFLFSVSYCVSRFVLRVAFFSLCATTSKKPESFRVEQAFFSSA